MQAATATEYKISILETSTQALRKWFVRVKTEVTFCVGILLIIRL